MMFGEKFGGDPKRICEEMGISTETFGKWLEEKAFKEMLEKSAEKNNYKEIAAVWKSLIDLCKGGNIQAIKFYFELKDKYGDGSSPVTENIIQIIDDIPKAEEENG
jgi:hypothetical protein